MAEALKLCGYPITHVTEVLPGGATGVPGRNRTPDDVIASWCAHTGRALVTIDEDFRGKWLRSGLLANAGVEVDYLGPRGRGSAGTARTHYQALPLVGTGTEPTALRLPGVDSRAQTAPDPDELKR